MHEYPNFFFFCYYFFLTYKLFAFLCSTKVNIWLFQGHEKYDKYQRKVINNPLGTLGLMGNMPKH